MQNTETVNVRVLRTSPTNMSDSSIIKMQLLMTNPIIRQISQFLNIQPAHKFIVMVLKLLTFIL